jgi:hypothetical protein
VHLDILRQDLRDAVRALRRAPGFALTAILVAGLGIGTATAAFSITDHVLLGPLPFPDAHRLVKLWEDQSSRGYSRMELLPPHYRDWERLSTSFESMAAFTGMSANLAGLGDPRRLEGALMSASLFRTLGRQAALGRTFIEADGRPDAPLTVVLSDALWQTAFGANPDVLGRPITLNDATYVVIGVMPGDVLSYRQARRVLPPGDRRGRGAAGGDPRRLHQLPAHDHAGRHLARRGRGRRRRPRRRSPLGQPPLRHARILRRDANTHRLWPRCGAQRHDGVALRRGRQLVVRATALA